MTNPPKLRGIPLNTAQQTDANSFAPVYDPVAIRFARRANFAIGTAIALILLYPISLIFNSPAVSAAVDSDSAFIRMLSGFVLPIILTLGGLLAVTALTPRIGFDLPRAYSATADALRNWLPTAAGEFPEPKENPVEDLKDNFATPEHSIRFILEADDNSILKEAAKAIARQSSEPLTLISRDNRHSYLRLNSSDRYELTAS